MTMASSDFMLFHEENDGTRKSRRGWSMNKTKANKTEKKNESQPTTDSGGRRKERARPLACLSLPCGKRDLKFTMNFFLKDIEQNSV